MHSCFFVRVEQPWTFAACSAFALRGLKMISQPLCNARNGSSQTRRPWGDSKNHWSQPCKQTALMPQPQRPSAPSEHRRPHTV
jgi:hypothetical protein